MGYRGMEYGRAPILVYVGAYFKKIYYLVYYHQNYSVY